MSTFRRELPNVDLKFSHLWLGLDPGPEQTALVAYDAAKDRPQTWMKFPNETILGQLGHPYYPRDPTPHLAIEMVASYGMPVGREVFETCVWAGRFIERWLSQFGPFRAEHSVRPLYRRDVKLHLCGSQRAKDSNVRQALIDRYGPGRDKAVGRKASPGPLYGMKADCWQALAVAITAAETMLEAGREAAA